MPGKFLRTLAITLLVALNAYTVLATCGGGGGGGVGGVGADVGGLALTPDLRNAYNLPWMLAGPTADSAPPGAELILYWFPTSREQALESDLLSSRKLLGYASRCLTLALVTSQNDILTDRFETRESKPMALLANGEDVVVARLTAAGAPMLKRGDVEKLVESEYKRREKIVKQQMNEAKSLRKSGRIADAIERYHAVHDQQCFFPKKARDAAKELSKLGESVADAFDVPVHGWDFSPEATKQISEHLEAGLAAEEGGNHLAALSHYDQARRLDPADPVPLRFLGELHRHHTGDWDEARRIFEQMLAMPADTVSQAIALHGLGKMTIHGGDFDGGLKLIEKSIETHPTALAYRNLAVYWNGEEHFDKAFGYAKMALETAPDDPYNEVFLATYLVNMGEQERALEIAAEHRGMLEGSYNLAAIYAQTGDHRQALELLRRHFYEYERTYAVRAKEMWEARQDYVFADLMDDPEFIELTALASQYGAPD